MNKKYLSLYLNTVKKAALKSGLSLKKEFFLDRKINSASKRDVHLEGDIESENLIKKVLTEKFPEIGFWGEESGRSDNNNKYWVVDPLDGTVNYYFYNPLFSISIALVEGQDIVFALIYAPITDEFFWAGKNEGAFYQGKKIKMASKNQEKIVFGGYSDQKRCEHVSNFGLPDKQILNKMEMGCASLELAYVGSGRITSYLLEKIRLWDVAAGILFIKEAGGQVTNWQGRDWTIEDKYLLASNDQKIHNKILNKISLSKEPC